MKKIIYVLLSFYFVSCTNLDSERYDTINPGFFPNTEKDADALITASVYAPFRNSDYNGIFNCASGIQIIGDMTTDLAVCCWINDAWTPLTHHNWTANHSYTTTQYTNYVKFLGTMTLTQERIANVTMSDEARSRMNAEIHMGRGWLAFLLYDFYGPVPIPTLEQLNNPLAEGIIPRATQGEMTAFIETELKAALEGLPVRTSSFGRFDKGLAYTVLMKFYMHEKSWEKAIECGRELIKPEYKYGLMDSYASIFTLENEQNEEIIYACTEERGTQLELWHDHCLPGNYPLKNNSIQRWDGFKVPWKFYHTFDKNDDRLSVLIGEYEGSDGVLFNEETDIAKRGDVYSGAVPVKYGEDPESTGDGSQIDWIVYRYADVLTLLSEAIVRNSNVVTQEAVDLLNQVRMRAKLKAYTMGDIKGVEDFLDKVLEERGHEFWWEGVRRSDLIRHGKFIQGAIDRGSTTTKPEFVLFPLPQAVINEGKGIIIQNPGY
ncbi:RagB/SusD family nutrient uptake outer membrane protein [Parabacteroides gordonii]|uniref:RagB/SusD domain-containing protein n=1 Tax=Parabacteroides gordonii MS-1 = DSM 23371 TaxID=1203610 RepID=A0A0F5JCF0_9BACT|nr:RagB/SusD family nutrient uptake outer membrane protein [Parabacteroides gordonii]KKB55454.1 hypothetical protein HMPREF1536_02923 [Parabacteroides gordonii MS-1 = DSM 23371]MCA5581753.1 RagB/SusD family nutrient uptake outer membrane protein [Parabacteroides gordonii]RGP18002.1 RagB/SusD family nutrient uptake outer membrane protein [Parabacteroides gordonii]